MTTYLIFGTVISLVLLFFYYMSLSDSGTDKVIDVRKTPERQIEDLTVEEFHETARDHLSARGFAFESSGEGYYLARNRGELIYVRVDPAAECQDPRTMNQLILNVRKSDADSALLVTSRAIKGQSYSLAQRTNMEIVTPDDLVEDQRESS